jgi:hypothetical protein
MGVFVNYAAGDAYSADEADTGLSLGVAHDDGVWIGLAEDDGVVVDRAGSPAATTASDLSNGFEVSGAEGHGVYVGWANQAAVAVEATGGEGIWVGSAARDGVAVGDAGNAGVYVHSADDDGIHVRQAGDPNPPSGSGDADWRDHGVEVAAADYDGVRVGYAGEAGIHVERAVRAGVYVREVADPKGNWDPVGVWVGRTESHGVHVVDAGWHGVAVSEAAGVGFAVGQAGQCATIRPNDGSSGFEVICGEDEGLYVGHAGRTAVLVTEAGWNGLVVESAEGDGARMTGVVYNAYHGDTTSANGQWGFHTPDKISAANVTMNSLTLIAQVTGPEPLARGDLVAADGVAPALPGGHSPLPLVRLAGAGGSIVGVVEGRMAFTRVIPPEGVDVQERDPELRSAEGPAQAGDYVALTVLGVAQVKVDTTEKALPAGTRLTAAARGLAGPLKTVVVEGVTLSESAPVVGTTLDTPDEDGYVWVLVNPQ